MLSWSGCSEVWLDHFVPLQEYIKYLTKGEEGTAGQRRGVLSSLTKVWQNHEIGAK